MLLILILLSARTASFAKRGPSKRGLKRNKNKGGSHGGRAAVAGARTRLAAELDMQHNAAMALMAAGRHEEAGLGFERIINADPNAVDSWSALGACMVELKPAGIHGVLEAGSEAKLLESQFANLSAVDGALPTLPCGRRLCIATGTLKECNTGGRPWSSAAVLCRWLLRHAADLRGTSVWTLSPRNHARMSSRGRIA